MIVLLIIGAAVAIIGAACVIVLIFRDSDRRWEALEWQWVPPEPPQPTTPDPGVTENGKPPPAPQSSHDCSATTKWLMHPGKVVAYRMCQACGKVEVRYPEPDMRTFR